MTISETLAEATLILQAGGVAEARREAKSLLAFALNVNQAFLIAHSADELSGEQTNLFQNLVTRRARREPFQYVVGKQEFCGLDFAVTPDVLIPRPETEMIVQAAIEFLREKPAPTFCEIGTGSGCIAVSILHSVEPARAVGLDISEAALGVARKNADAHSVGARLTLKTSDVYENLGDEKFGIIASNPPYIPASDLADLQPEVRDYEPRHALTDARDGLSIIERIVGGAPRFLQPGGALLMEIGVYQSAPVEKMFDRRLWSNVEIVPDFQNIPRMVKALKN